MEVTVYLNFDARVKGNKAFCRRVNCPDTFEYDAFVRVMKSVFGKDCVIEFLIV